MELNTHALNMEWDPQVLMPSLGRERRDKPSKDFLAVQTAASVRMEAIDLPEAVLRKPMKVVAAPAPEELAQRLHVRILMDLASRFNAADTPVAQDIAMEAMEKAGISPWEVALALPKNVFLPLLEPLGVKEEVLQSLRKAGPVFTEAGLSLRGPLRLQNIHDVSLPIARIEGGLVLWRSSNISFPFMTHCGGPIQAERTAGIRLPMLTVADDLYATNSEGMGLDRLVRAKALYIMGAKRFFAPMVQEVEENLWLGETDDAFLGNLHRVGGNVAIASANKMPTPLLEDIGGDLVFSDMPEANSPMLRRVGGSLLAIRAGKVSLSSLEQVGKAKWFHTSTLHAPNLVYAERKPSPTKG